MALNTHQMYPNPGDEAAVSRAWENFLLSGRERHCEELRALVDVSWQRCLEARVDPRRHSGPNPLSDTELFLRQERQRDLMEASAPVMSHARSFLAQTGTLMALADTDSTILRTEGDPHAIGSAETIRLMPGVAWSESLCGTNAIGTALAAGEPVQVHSAEHYCEGIKRWTCSATVIRHPSDGEIIGVLDVSGLPSTFSRQSLALVITSAGRIESRIKAIELEARYRLLDHAMSRIAAAGQDGVILLDRRGGVIKFNAHAQQALALAGVSFDLGQVRVLAELSGARLGRDPQRARLPSWVRSEWLHPLVQGHEHLGTLMVLPTATANGRARTHFCATPKSSTHLTPLDNVITADTAMQTLIQRTRALANCRTPVLLQGETGTGKELFAHGLHAGAGPFIAVNCGGLPRDLLASELFGYTEGAFTGARKGGMVGKIEGADGGTLFLDEIGEMPMDMQAHLLRVLEAREIYRLGENTSRKVRFRLIAATHRDLRQAVQSGQFRMDLYYRIAVTSLRIPPLRERGDDILLLARSFLQHFAREQGQPDASFDAAAQVLLRRYAWPGNVRELRNVVENALLLADGATMLTVDMLPADLQHDCRHPPTQAGEMTSIADNEQTLIRQTIEACGGNLTLAARRLQIAKSTLYAKMSRYRISRHA